jgi:hypothetical protein
LNKLPERIDEAESALVLRARELFYSPVTKLKRRKA